MKIEDVPMPGPGKIAETMIFNVIWKTRERKSFISGSILRDMEQTPFFYNCFCHVLAKGQNKWPYFKWYYRNIQLITPLEHHLWDFGTEEQRINYALELEEKSGGKTTADWAKLKALEEELKEEYKKYFPTTRGLMIGQKYNLMEVMAIVGMLNERYMASLKPKA